MPETIPRIENRSILTPTGGFLAEGYTHSLNAYAGCAFAGGSCGVYCYVQHNQWITRGRPWGFYGAKSDIRGAYRRDVERERRAGRPVKIYMSSSTDPYVPQEASLMITRALLEEMVQRPPDVLVIQTRNPLITRDRDVIAELFLKCRVWVSLTIETDLDRVPGFPPHPTPIGRRFEALASFRLAGVPAQATVSPMLPIADLDSFAGRLDEAADRVIVDHVLLGDGSPNGFRTRATDFADRLRRAGYGEWAELDKFREVRDFFSARLGRDRVLVSSIGFNSE